MRTQDHSEALAFRTVGGRNVVFSEYRQKLFELNDVAAFIWCRLQDGLQPQAIAAEMAAKGIDLAIATSFIRKSLTQWRRVGLIDRGLNGAGDRNDISIAPRRLSEAATPSRRRRKTANGPQQSLVVAGLAIEIAYSSDQIAAAITPTFRHLECDRIVPQVRLAAIEDDGRVILLRDDREVLSCRRNEIVPTLKWQLTEEVLSLGRYEIVLHAACVVRNGAALLMFGAPGTGKTTLCLALVDAGMGFAGDDVTLVHPGGRAQGVPLPPALKRGAWSFAQQLGLDLDQVPAHQRLDRKLVKFVVPGQVWTEALPIRGFIMLDRHATHRAALTPLDRIDALRKALAEAFMPHRKLSTSAFDSLVAGLSAAECYALSYADYADAVALLERTFR
jgi:hypothetical protein